MPRDEVFTVPAELDAAEILIALQVQLDRSAAKSAWVAERPRPFARRVTYLDTFDWRLARAGWVLRASSAGDSGAEEKGNQPGRYRGSARRGGGLDLDLSPVPLPGKEGRLNRRVRSRAMPARPEDLPAGSLRETLLPLVGVRSLLPVVHVESKGFEILLRSRIAEIAAPLDAGGDAGPEGKLLGTLILEERHAFPPGGRKLRPLQRRLRVTPLLGYEGSITPPVRRIAEQLGLEARAADPGSELAEALAPLGRSIGDYSSKIELMLEPEACADEAMRQVIRQLLKVVLVNESGVRSAADIEFLHDFRVAVRRLRSAIGQVREVFPPDRVETLRRELRWLGRVTGPKRDHDVFLETFDEYLEDLPDWVRGGLEGLRAFLVSREEHEQEELVAALDSERYRRLIAELKAVARPRQGAKGEPELPANATRPIWEVAGESLHRAAKKVRKRAAAVGSETPAEQVHRLRIQGKKYRYLLEMFRSLYPKGELSAEIKTLKKLQEVLGTFNDLAVQGATLRRLASKMEAEEEVATAIGFLIARLEERQKDIRDHLGAALEKYLQPENRRRERKLFATAKKAKVNKADRTKAKRKKAKRAKGEAR